MCICAVIAACLHLHAAVEYFEYKYEGNTFYFHTLDDDPSGCLLSTSASDQRNTSPSGDCALPKVAYRNGTGYQVRGIDENAFRGNTKIRTVSIPDGYESIGDAAFAQCSKLQSIYLPSTMKSLGESAFARCENMNEAALNEGLTTIGKWCFLRTILKRVYIPSTVTSIGDAAFASFVLKEIFVDPENTRFAVRDGVLYTKNYNGKLICYPARLPLGDKEYIEILNVKAACYEVENGTEEIGEGAFFNADLGRVTIPESVYKIGDAIFLNCQLLLEVYLEWEGYSLNSLRMPDKMFAWPDSDQLFTDDSRQIYVPEGLKSTYQNMSAWKDFSINEYDVPIRDFTIGGQHPGRNALANCSSQGNISYDRFYKILTLEGANITSSKNKPGLDICYDGDFRIEVHGSSVIYGDLEALTVSEGGSVEIECMNETAVLIINNKHFANNSSYPAIRLAGSSAIYFTDCTLNIYSQQLPAISGDDSARASLTFYNTSANIDKPASTSYNRSLIWSLKEMDLMDCYIDSPAGAYYDTTASALMNAEGTYLKEALTIKQGREEVSEITIGNRPVTSTHVPFVESGSATYDPANNRLTLNNCVIRTDNDGIYAQDGLNLTVIGDNYVYSKGNGMTLLGNDCFFNGTGKLTVESSAGYGVSVENMLETYDNSGLLQLDIYGKLGALDGRKWWSNYYSEYQYGYLASYGMDITLRSDGNRPVIHECNIVNDDDNAFVYNNYRIDNDVHTIVYGTRKSKTPVTKPVRMVSKDKLEIYDLKIMGNSVNNYNESNFDPQNLRSGQVYLEEDYSGEKNLVLDNAQFDNFGLDPKYPEYNLYALMCTLPEINILVKGDCYLPGNLGMVFGEFGYHTAASIIGGSGTNNPGNDRLRMLGGFYLEGDPGEDDCTNLSISYVSIQSDDFAYVWSQDDCKLNLTKCELDLNCPTDDDTIMEYIILSMKDCHFEGAGIHYDENQKKVCYADGSSVKGHLRIRAGKPDSTGLSAPDSTGCGFAASSAPAYNLQGQRVGNDYRGIVIKGGKKILR